MCDPILMKPGRFQGVGAGLAGPTLLCLGGVVCGYLLVGELPQKTQTGERGLLHRFTRQRPGTPIVRLLAYSGARLITTALLTLFYRLRVFGRERVPRDGALLIVANHQSYLDPPVIGCAIRSRHLDYIARAGLFESRVVGGLITTFNSIPIKEEGGDAGAIKEVLRRLDEGRAVLIFPEGTRSPDGAMREFKRGVALLVKRSRCPVLPVAVEGAFDAWPRDRKRPRVFGQRVAVCIGEPIEHEALMAGGAEEGLRRLEREIDAMRLDLRKQLRRETEGQTPAPGPGDGPAFA
jgi:1-acyl-sn-glycerol-3-phosphate acyltransferase